MPNIKSAVKRVKVSEKKNLINRSVKSEIATASKTFLKLIKENNVAEAEKALSEVVALMDKAVANNIIHANKASRKQAHYSKLLDNAKKSA